MSIKGKNFIIIGATGGIGSGLAREIVSNEGNCFLVSRNSSKLSALSNELEQPFKVLDSTNLDLYLDLLDDINIIFPQIDGIINCAGSLLLKPIATVNQNDWMQAVNANLTTAIFALKLASKCFKEQSGSVVLCSSAASSIGLANHEIVSGCKAAINGMVKSAAASFANKNIRVNAVAPGLTDTPLTSHLFAKERSVEFAKKLHPLGNRLGVVKDVVNMILFLIDSDNSWITGQTIAIDGGLSTIK